MGGTFTGTLTNAGTLVATGGTAPARSLAGGTIRDTDTGRMSWNGGGPVDLANGRIENAGVFLLNADGLALSANSGTVAFVNEPLGLLRKNAGTGTTVVTVPVTNQSLAFIEVETGTLALQGGGTLSGGRYEAVSGARLLFDAGTFTLSGTLGGAPEGFVGTEAGALSPTLAVPSAATFEFSGLGFNWAGGTIAGPGTLTNALQLVITEAATKTLSNGTIRNTGPMFWNGGGTVSLASGRIENAGQFFLEGDGLALSGGAGAFSFVNQAGGLLAKDVGTGTAIVGVPVTNQQDGRIEVYAGTLEFTQTLDHQASAAIRGNATIDVPADVLLTNAGFTAPRVSDEDETGRLTWAGNFNPTDTAILNINLEGTTAGTDYDQLAVTGSATLNGRLDLFHGIGFSPAVGTSFTVLTAASVSGAFDLVLGPNDYTYSIAYNPTSVVVTVTAQPAFEIQAANTTPLTVAPGGSVRFLYAILNNTANPATGDLWFTATPGNLQGRIRSGTLPGHGLIEGTHTQPIPGNAPPGTYEYRLNVGRFPDDDVDFAQFTIEVTGAPEAREPEARAADEVTGSAEGANPLAAAGADPPAAFVLHGAYPNPFREVARLTLTVPSAQPVRVAVYDALGREAAVLHDGPMAAGAHALALDGSALAPGVYVVRAGGAGGAAVRRVVRY
jgi:hypothetical protein